MTTIRCFAALCLLATSIAMGQSLQGPGTIVAKDSFTLTQAPTGTNIVKVFLEDDPDPAPLKVWKVVAGSAEQAAKRTWKADARCGMRLKSLTVKQADGKIHDFKPAEGVKNLQKEASLTTFAPARFKKICLDIANGTTDSANPNDELIPLHELQKRQTQFANNQIADPWTVKGEVLLSGRCTSPDGTSTVTNVVDKKFPAQIDVQCCTSCG